MRRPRVASCLGEITQQIHSFRASGVRLFQAAWVAGVESTARRKSAGIVCMGAGLLVFFRVMVTLRYL
jgi:hypothetical protein